MKAAGERLDGWKEIACHLNRSVRCVQRWERREKLPVQRHGHVHGVSVYAFRGELDAWWRESPAGSSDAVKESKEGNRAPGGAQEDGRQNSLAACANGRAGAELALNAREIGLLVFLLEQLKNRHLREIQPLKARTNKNSA